MVVTHLKKIFCQLEKDCSQGTIVANANSFTLEEVQTAWAANDASKAIGPDELDTKDMPQTAVDKYQREILHMLQTGIYPEYLSHAKVVLLSKKAGAVCHVEDTRCIQILNHITKIIERVAYTRI